MNTPVRICSICLRELPETVEFFNKNSHCPKGLLNICRQCRSEKRKREYSESEVVRAKNREAGQRRYWADPEGHRAKARAYAKEHSAEACERIRKWRENNPERYHASLTYRARRDHFASKRDYYRAICENRRAQKIGAQGKYTSKHVTAMLIAQSGRCFYCLAELTDMYHVDHVIPLSRGGSNSPDNLVLACPFCNTSKGNRSLEEWRPITHKSR